MHSQEMFQIYDKINEPVMVCLDDSDFCYVLHAPIEIQNKLID